MISGHAATTLIAKRATPEMHWWLLLVSAFLIDIAMFTFVALGIETMAPTGTDGPTLANVIVDMTFSHDLIPQIGWTLLAGAIAFAVTRRPVFALIAMALSLAHWLADLVSGYGHNVFGPDSHPLGTDWYHLNLPAALSFEAALGIFCVFISRFAHFEMSFRNCYGRMRGLAFKKHIDFQHFLCIQGSF